MDINYIVPLLYISLNLSDSDRATTPLQRSWMEGSYVFLLVSSFHEYSAKITVSTQLFYFLWNINQQYSIFSFISISGKFLKTPVLQGNGNNLGMIGNRLICIKVSNICSHAYRR